MNYKTIAGLFILSALVFGDPTSAVAGEEAYPTIPGMTVHELNSVVIGTGLYCFRPTQNSKGYFWVCPPRQARENVVMATLSLQAEAIAPNHIFRISGSAGGRTGPRTLSKWLGAIAAVPYNGGEPAEARRWVEATIQGFGKPYKESFEAIFGGMKFTLILHIGGGALTVEPQQLTEPPPIPKVDAKIQIVWPHDEQGRPAPVATAAFVNVEVYLFERGTLNPVPCDFPNEVALRWTRNAVFPGGAAQEPAYNLLDDAAMRVGHRINRTIGNKTFSAWTFDNVPITFSTPNADHSRSRTFFFVNVVGADLRTNVWSHAADSRTFYPAQRRPTGVGLPDLAPKVPIIQIVWPHDVAGNERPVTEAGLVNIGVDVVDPETWASVGLGFPAHSLQCCRLLVALNDGFLEEVRPLTDSRPTMSIAGISWPRWEFNDVQVPAARDPANKYFFAAIMWGRLYDTTIWAHGADARTIFPQKDIPATSGANCP